ncbi:MAG: hypothetical protein ACFFCS_20815 [Candidatus Hodarchaeota archaeon]
MFAFFSVYVDDSSFKPDEGMVKHVMSLLAKHGIVGHVEDYRDKWLKIQDLGEKILINLVSTREFNKFVNSMLGIDPKNDVKITMQVSESGGSFDGRCFNIPTRFYLLDMCFNTDGYLPLDEFEPQFMERYQDLIAAIAIYLGKGIKITTCQ